MLWDKMAAKQQRPQPAVGGGGGELPRAPGQSGGAAGNMVVRRPAVTGNQQYQTRCEQTPLGDGAPWAGIVPPLLELAERNTARPFVRPAGPGAPQSRSHTNVPPHPPLPPGAHARRLLISRPPNSPRALGKEMATVAPTLPQWPLAPTSKVTRPRGSPPAAISKKTTGLAMARHEQCSRLSSVQQARRSRRSPAPRRSLYSVEEGPPPPQRWPTVAGGVAEWQGRQPIGGAEFERGGREKSAGGAGAAVRCSAGRGAHAPCGEQGEAGWGGSGTG